MTLFCVLLQFIASPADNAAQRTGQASLRMHMCVLDRGYHVGEALFTNQTLWLLVLVNVEE